MALIAFLEDKRDRSQNMVHKAGFNVWARLYASKVAIPEIACIFTYSRGLVKFISEVHDGEVSQGQTGSCIAPCPFGLTRLQSELSGNEHCCYSHLSSNGYIFIKIHR
jgi:hypothetical protein